MDTAPKTGNLAGVGLTPLLGALPRPLTALEAHEKVISPLRVEWELVTGAAMPKAFELWRYSRLRAALRLLHAGSLVVVDGQLVIEHLSLPLDEREAFDLAECGLC